MKKHLFLLVSVMFFASSILFTDKLRIHIPLFTLNSMRFLLGGTLLLVLGGRMSLKSLNLKDILWSLIRGILGITLYYSLETAAMYFISPHMVSILVGLAFILSISYELMKKEVKMTLKLMGIILLVVTGMVIVSWRDMIATPLESLVAGTSIMLAANISWVAYTRLTKTKPKVLNPMQIVSMDMILGAFCILPFALLEISRGQIQLKSAQILDFFYLAVFPSAVAYYLYNRSAQIMRGSICSIYLNMIPVLSVLILTFTSASSLTSLEWGGMVLLISCIVMYSISY